jgi:hypothetical protein
VISGNVLWLIGVVGVLLVLRPPFEIGAAVVAITVLGFAYQAAHHGRHWRAVQAGERLELREHRCPACEFRWFQFDASPAMIAFETQRLERDLRVARVLRNRHATASLQATLALYALYGGERARAEALCAEARARYREFAIEKGATACQVLLAQSLVGWDDAWATALAEESLAEARAQENWAGVAQASLALAFARLSREPSARVAPLLCESLRLSRALGDRPSMAWGLEGLSCVAGRARDWQRSGVLLGAAAALREASGVPAAPIALAMIREAADATRAALGAAAASAWDDGRELAAGDVRAFACPGDARTPSAPAATTGAC